jgi:hypothetical protein
MSESIKVIMTKGNKKIVMEVLPDGEVKITTEGFVGKSCLEESKFLKEALGSEISTQLTPAYFMTDQKTVVKKHLGLCG